MDDWNERFSKASKIMDNFNNSISSEKSSRFQTAEIEFGDDSAPQVQKSSPIKKLYDFFGNAGENAANHDANANPAPQTKTEVDSLHNSSAPTALRSTVYELDGGVMITCKIEDWSKGFTLFNDFLRDAKKYYRKTCVNANYVYFFSYRPMYRELSHEQLCWYLFWRSRIRDGTYPKTGLSYIFLYLYEQINLSDIIGCEKVYENIIKIWKNYRNEFPRIDKFIAEWLTDFSFINKVKINLNDIEDILPHIVNIVTIPEVYISEDFFKNKSNTAMIINNMSVYDYKKSKFYNEKNKELFDYHAEKIANAVLSSAEFGEIIKKETEDGVRIKNTRESFMGAVCVYEHKKRITVEYKNLYKNFYVRQCITDTLRYAENALRDYLNIKSKLTVTAFPGQLKKIIDDYKDKYLASVKTPKISVAAKKKKQDEDEEIPETVEFNPNIETAAEIEKSSWDTTMTLVELQTNDKLEILNIECDVEEEFGEIEVDDGEFIAIDTGTSETYEELEEISPDTQTPVGFAATPFQKGADTDIFDVLEDLENSEILTPDSEFGRFAESLSEEESTALELLLSAKASDKSFDILCGEFLSQHGKMLESVVDAVNEKAMDYTGDIIFDTASREIIEDYRDEIIKYI